jgi:IS5 family transposase
VLLRQSAQLHDLSEHAAIDATFCDRSPASRHYYQRISYRVQKLKVTKLVDTASQAVFYVHCSTNQKGSDADPAEQIARIPAGDLRSLAANMCYGKQTLRESLCEPGIRPLIKHHIFAPYDHAHNARIDNKRYNQRSMTETVNPAVKRSLGFAVRAQS